MEGEKQKNPRKEGSAGKMLRKAKNAFARAAVLVSTIAVFGIGCERAGNVPQESPPTAADNPPVYTSPEEAPECVAERKYLECGKTYELMLSGCGLEHYECADHNSYLNSIDYYSEHKDDCDSVQMGPLKIKVLSFDVMPPDEWLLERGINETRAEVRMELTSECGDAVQFSFDCGIENIEKTDSGIYKYFDDMLPEYYNALALYPVEVSNEPGNEYVKLALLTAACDSLPKYCFLAGGEVVNGIQSIEKPNLFDDYELGVNEAGEVLIKDRESGDVLKVIGEDDLAVSRFPKPDAIFPSEFREYEFLDYIILVQDIHVLDVTWRGAYVMYPCLKDE